MTMLARDRNGGVIQALGLGAVQNIAFGASSTQSAPVGQVTTIRLIATADCWVSEGEDPIAGPDTSAYIAAGVPEYIRINHGDRIAVAQVSAPGSLNIVECD